MNDLNHDQSPPLPPIPPLPPRLESEGETLKNYEHFISYVSLGSDRSIDRAYSEYLKNSNKIAKKSWHFHHLSARFNWPDRAAEYDRLMLEFVGKTLANRFNEKIVSYHEKFEMIFDVLLKLSLRLLTLTMAILSLPDDEMIERSEDIEILKSLSEILNKLSSTVGKNIEMWAVLNDVEAIADRLSELEKRYGKNPTDSLK